MLHTHLPWVAHAGAWPVGEEWLHQAWSASYLPGRAGAGAPRRRGPPRPAHPRHDPGARRHARRPLLPARAAHLAGVLADPGRGARRGAGGAPARAPAAREWRAATDALADFEARWRHGASAVLRPLVDSGVVELIGGPATHPFQPLLEPRVRRAQLESGLDDTARRLGRRPAGIWAPECGYAPGLEELYAAQGVQRFLVDSPAVHGDTADAHPVGGSDVVAFARDLEVTYRVWSPRSGYPGGRWYRDFHSFDHPSGFRPYRVTSRQQRREGPLRPRRRGRRGRGRRGGLRRARGGPARPTTGPSATAARAWSRSPTTPSCSATGGTRARPGSSRCCGCCPRPGCGSPRWPARSGPGTSAPRWSCPPRRGGPARTGGSGTASRCRTWWPTPPGCSAACWPRSTPGWTRAGAPPGTRCSTSSCGRRSSSPPATGRSASPRTPPPATPATGPPSTPAGRDRLGRPARPRRPRRGGRRWPGAAAARRRRARGWTPASL